jgi:hypothetical protein
MSILLYHYKQLNEYASKTGRGNRGQNRRSSSSSSSSYTSTTTIAATATIRNETQKDVAMLHTHTKFLTLSTAQDFHLQNAL